MIGLIARRLAQLPLVLAVIYTLTLVLAWGIPGNPLTRPEGRRPPPEVEAAMTARYRLDSFAGFYTSYLARATGLAYASDSIGGQLALERERAAARGLAPPVRRVFDLGPSLQYRDRTVNEIIGASLPVSVLLGTGAMVFALIVGVGAGVAGSLRPNSPLDAATLALSLVGISLPTFVIGAALVMIFSLWAGWFPVGEWGRPRDLVLPTVTLGLPFAAYIARLTRMGMIEQLASDHVRTARAKGAPEWRVVLVHALKNAFLPVLSYLGPATAFAMTGSFVVERVFSIPGMGQHFVAAVQNKDLFLLIGVVLVYSTLLILLNLAVDVLYRWADPRVR